MKHGTDSTYHNHGCRCAPCRKAHAAQARQLKAGRPPLADDDPRHGTANGYQNWRCRCAACTAAWADSHREWMNAKPERKERHAQRARMYYAAKRRTAA